MLSIIKDWRHLKHDSVAHILTPLGEFYPFAFSNEGHHDEIEIFEICNIDKIHNHHSISRIEKFLKLDKKTQDTYDCFKFLSIVCAIPKTFKYAHTHVSECDKISDYDCELREIYESEFGKLKLGDTLIISEKDFANPRSRNIKIHALLYLGANLFISKLGFKGRVVISTFETLLSIYPYIFIYRLTFQSA